jgi:hypothetical protein
MAVLVTGGAGFHRQPIGSRAARCGRMSWDSIICLQVFGGHRRVPAPQLWQARMRGGARPSISIGATIDAVVCTENFIRID